MTGPLTEFERMMVRILIWSQLIGAVLAMALIAIRLAARALA